MATPFVAGAFAMLRALGQSASMARVAVLSSATVPQKLIHRLHSIRKSPQNLLEPPFNVTLYKKKRCQSDVAGAKWC